MVLKHMVKMIEDFDTLRDKCWARWVWFSRLSLFKDVILKMEPKVMHDEYLWQVLSDDWLYEFVKSHDLVNYTLEGTWTHVYIADVFASHPAEMSSALLCKY